MLIFISGSPSLVKAPPFFRLFQTLALWLDEPRLHNPTLFLQGLPPAYDADRLTKVLIRDDVRKKYCTLL